MTDENPWDEILAKITVTSTSHPVTLSSPTSAAGSLTYVVGGNTASYALGEYPSSPILFTRWLSETLRLQTEFYKDISNLPQEELEDWMRVNAFAAEDEIHEAMNEISWKPWAKSEFFHREAFIGECVDALHFVGNMLAAAGCTDGELNAAYLEKMERNRERQRAGYTGTDKCDICNRASDDIIAHGGAIRERRQPDSDTGTPVGYGCDKCYGGSGDEKE